MWDARTGSGGGAAAAMARGGGDVRRNMGQAFAVAWCRDGETLAVGFESGDVCFLERSGGLDTRGIVKAHSDAVRALAWDQGTARLASCGDDGVTAGPRTPSRLTSPVPVSTLKRVPFTLKLWPVCP